MANMPSAASLVSIRAQLADVIESARRFPQANAAACRVDLALYRETSEMGYFESAERYCNRALTLDRQDPEVHVPLGGLYRASGQLDLALSSLELATSLAPFSTAALRELALMLDKRGDFAAAEVQLLKALEIEPNGWRNYHELSGLHFRAVTTHRPRTTTISKWPCCQTTPGRSTTSVRGYSESLIESDANFDSALNRPVTTTMEEP